MPHVVVIGAGFGGLKAVEELRARHAGVAITLVAPSPRFLYWPSLVWVPSGWREPEDLTVDVRDWLFRQRAAYHEAAVVGVRDGGRTVETTAGALTADGLIIASGATTAAAIWGSEHAFAICGGLDAARGIRMATESYDDPEPVNIGAGFEITIRELAGKIREMTGFEGEIRWDTSKPDGQPRRCLDTTRAAERFGFRAEVDFDEGLRRTVEWYRENRPA